MTHCLSIHKGMTEDQIKHAVADIVRHMELDRVLSVMDFLQWKWYMRLDGVAVFKVPTYIEFFDMCVEHGIYVVNRTIRTGEPTTRSSGGIEASTNIFEDGCIGLTIKFVLTEWDNYL